jgi:hypothetical protein
MVIAADPGLGSLAGLSAPLGPAARVAVAWLTRNLRQAAESPMPAGPVDRRPAPSTTGRLCRRSASSVNRRSAPSTAGQHTTEIMLAAHDAACSTPRRPGPPEGPTRFAGGLGPAPPPAEPRPQLRGSPLPRPAGPATGPGFGSGPSRWRLPSDSDFLRDRVQVWTARRR